MRPPKENPHIIVLLCGEINASSVSAKLDAIFLGLCGRLKSSDSPNPGISGMSTL